MNKFIIIIIIIIIIIKTYYRDWGSFRNEMFISSTSDETELMAHVTTLRNL
jgi:hypothetical protein